MANDETEHARPFGRKAHSCRLCGARQQEEAPAERDAVMAALDAAVSATKSAWASKKPRRCCRND